MAIATACAFRFSATAQESGPQVSQAAPQAHQGTPEVSGYPLVLRVAAVVKEIKDPHGLLGENVVTDQAVSAVFWADAPTPKGEGSLVRESQLQGAWVRIGSSFETQQESAGAGVAQIVDGGVSENGAALPDILVLRGKSNTPTGQIEITGVSLQLEFPQGGIAGSGGVTPIKPATHAESLYGLMIRGRLAGSGDDAPEVAIRCEITSLSQD